MPAVSFVVNGSLAGVSERFLPLCLDFAKRNDWTAEFHVTDKAESGVDAAKGAALDGADLVVAVGGDGTVRGCAEGLASTGVPLGIVPHGTANLLARTLGIPSHLHMALNIALGTPDCVDRRIDLAIADREPFTAMAGMGLDAAVVAGTKLKHQFGWLAYAMSGAAHLALPPARFTIKCDDGPPIERTARSVVVGNSGLLPGGFSLLPDARLDDGLLDVGVLAPHGPLGWPRVATRVLTRSDHQDRMLERFQARKVEIISHVTLPREVDGEVLTPGHSLTVTVLPGALTVRMPAARQRTASGPAGRGVNRGGPRRAPPGSLSAPEITGDIPVPALKCESRWMENLPAIVEAAARGLAGANLTVLNGTQGVSEVVAGLVGQGMSILELLKNAAANGNGTSPSAVTGQVAGQVAGTVTGTVTEGRDPAGAPGGMAGVADVI